MQTIARVNRTADSRDKIYVRDIAMTANGLDNRRMPFGGRDDLIPDP